MIKRRAASLVELLVLMSACAAILTLSATLMHRVMRVQSKARAFFDVERSAMRLSQQFRQDVQQAKSAVAVPAELPAGVLLHLRLSDSQLVEYRAEAGVVQRRLLEGDEVVSREEFAFQPEIQVEASQLDSPGLISLTITNQAREFTEPPLRGPAEKPVNLQLQARLGRDFRFAQTPREQQGAP